VKEITSNENWGSSGQIKGEIADATHDFKACREIMNVLWKRLQERDQNWRAVFKSLELLMYLLKCGHERVVDEIRDHQFTLKDLQNFHYSDPSNGQDRGRGIRQLAQQILELVDDQKRLREVKEESQKQRRKLQEVSKTSLASDNYGGYNGNSNRYSRDEDRDRDRNRDREEDEDNSSKKTKKKRKSSSKEKNDDDFASWDDDENTKKKKKKKKAEKEEESNEETSDKEENEDEEASTKKKPKRKSIKKDKKGPIQV